MSSAFEPVTSANISAMPEFEGYRLVRSISYGNIRGSYCNRYQSIDNPECTISLRVVPCGDAAEARYLLLRELADNTNPRINRLNDRNGDISFGNASGDSAFRMLCRNNLFIKISVYGEPVRLMQVMETLCGCSDADL